MTFEEGTQRLEKICEKLQLPNVGIAEASELFAEGTRLVIRLEKELKSVEEKVETTLSKTETSSSDDELFPELRSMLGKNPPSDTS